VSIFLALNVTGEGVFATAHAPNVNIVDLLYSFDFVKFIFKTLDVHANRGTFHEDVNTLHENWPGCPHDNNGEYDRANGVQVPQRGESVDQGRG
jgi:hypothetical protein